MPSRGQWGNLLKPSDFKWRWRYSSTLVQVMAWCLTAPSHYLNQCWLTIKDILWHSLQVNNVQWNVKENNPVKENHSHIWRLWCQNHVSQAGISNYIPLCDVITYPCLRYLLLAPKSSYLRGQRVKGEVPVRPYEDPAHSTYLPEGLVTTCM